MEGEMKMFQIYEDDLAELERLVPQIAEALPLEHAARTKTQIRRVQRVLSNGRWNYGPHDHVEAIPADGIT